MLEDKIKELEEEKTKHPERTAFVDRMIKSIRIFIIRSQVNKSDEKIRKEKEDLEMQKMMDIFHE